MLINSNDYFNVLNEIKSKIVEAQYRAVLGVNKELISLYWHIGQTIITNTKYGAKFIENLSRDIKTTFPDVKGYSISNLKYMRKFAETYPDFPKSQRVVDLLPWRNNITLMTKVNDDIARDWYINQNINNGWNNTVLVHHIETKLYERQVITDKTTNYERLLPSPFSDLAQETLKNPYVFDFIEKRTNLIERGIERELIANIAKTILELGTGFAFCGHQHEIVVSGKSYYLDLLFYNTKLRCYVVIELKNTDFKPEYAGKLNFYLSAVDDIMKHEQDNPTIGIMLCKHRDKLTAEYALKDINKPIGVSEYKLSDFVPSEFINTLPTAEDIEKRIRMELDLPDNDE